MSKQNRLPVNLDPGIAAYLASPFPAPVHRNGSMTQTNVACPVEALD
ncbi:hypothetical protein [Pseudoduganella albidiflava]|nr:hypothetical protein [Pseudoduganella albidiflava]